MSHGGQCLAAFFVKMSGLFWPVLRIISRAKNVALEILHLDSADQERPWKSTRVFRFGQVLDLALNTLRLIFHDLFSNFIS